jgi:uncharacterized surface protein with fasciclin (FAS1) repeats
LVWAQNAFRKVLALFTARPGLTSRFFKYSFLTALLFFNLIVVFQAFSFYVARRNIDTELESKKISSLEYLQVLTRREHELTVATIETRCLERTQLALYRIYEGVLADNLHKAYNKLFEVKNEIVFDIQKNGPGLIDVEPALKSINNPVFSIFPSYKEFEPREGVSKDDPRYRALVDRLNRYREKYEEIGPAFAKDRADAVAKAAGYLKELNIQAIEERSRRLDAERQKTRAKHPDLDEVIAKYSTWKAALTGGTTRYLEFDARTAWLKDQDRKLLTDVECKNLEAYLVKLNEQDSDPATGKWAAFWAVYNDFLLRYFDTPPVGQTLLVTLFLGALGALTFNVLRLSKVGYWSNSADPLWGEIVISPLLGALAAFGIFLMGSAGLLLTSDVRGGVAPLSTSFIGILGFISGLLYDQAFGRVRLFGSQFFATGTPKLADEASAEDRELCQVLSDAGASLVARWVLKYRLGTELAQKASFTFLVPSDDAVKAMSVEAWHQINESESRAPVDAWVARHLVTKRVTKQEIVAAGDAGIKEIEVVDKTKLPVVVANGKLTIGGAEVVKADIQWKNGVIQILSKELAS